MGGAFSSIAHYVVLAVFCFVLLAILIFYSVVSVKLFKQLHNKNLNVAKSEKASKSTQLVSLIINNSFVFVPDAISGEALLEYS